MRLSSYDSAGYEDIKKKAFEKVHTQRKYIILLICMYMCNRNEVVCYTEYLLFSYTVESFNLKKCWNTDHRHEDSKYLMKFKTLLMKDCLLVGFEAMIE
jgi:hypothetical protein